MRMERMALQEAGVPRLSYRRSVASVETSIISKVSDCRSAGLVELGDRCAKAMGIQLRMKGGGGLSRWSGLSRSGLLVAAVSRNPTFFWSVWFWFGGGAQGKRRAVKVGWQWAVDSVKRRERRECVNELRDQ